MTPKERLDKLSTKQIAIDLFNIVSNGKSDMNNLVNYFDRIDEALTELEELKRDVKRYFELDDKPKTTKESNELYVLQGKLLKVGKEDE